MFDIGFSELLVIAVIALLVIGPERLPKVARTAGHLFGRLQRYVNDVKADIQREIELDELKKLRSQFEDAARSVEQSVNEVGQELRSASDDLNRSIAGDAPAPASPPAETPGALPEGAPQAPPTPSNEAKV
ncbi:MAG TPA: Sec-independent protein translocase protein TatB [Burkholderiales bacterium]|nr:Sec-independent protein translocase protein TatB [Burkholderiales bacterium]